MSALVRQPNCADFSQLLREEYDRSCRVVLEIKQSPTLLDTDPTLQRADCAAQPLRSIRCTSCRWICSSAGAPSGRQNRELFEALQASVSGIARGLQTTG